MALFHKFRDEDMVHNLDILWEMGLWRLDQGTVTLGPRKDPCIM